MGLGNLVLDVGRLNSGKTQVANIIDFAEQPWGLGLSLFPVQRVILKAHYGIPLDTKDKFKISDWRRENFRDVTEAEYLQILFDEGRCNIGQVVEGEERREMILSIGRRSGKTFIAAAIAAYEAYKLILKECPQGYYGLPVANTIGIISVATDKDQAGLLYKEVSAHFRSSGFFSPYTANNTMSYARFQTPKDILDTGRYVDNPQARATINVSFRSCIAKGLRGAGNLVAVLDEMAHFTDGGQSSADEVYNAIRPSLSAFSPKDPKDSRVPIGGVEGRLICISSPLGRQGTFYELFQLAMKGTGVTKNMLAIQAPTWEVNPTVPRSEFEANYLRNPSVFFTEYGADFTDRTRGWLERSEDLQACIDPHLKPLSAAPSRRPHFVGLDIGLVGDATAIALGHLDEKGRIVLDLLDWIKAGEGKFASYDRLDCEEVTDWIQALSRKFFFAEGIFDQWAGIPFEQALHKRGLKQLKSQFFNKQLNSQVYQNFKDMMWDQRLVLYDYPIPTGQAHCEYVMELLELQADYQSKYVVEVKAPNIDGKHDDRSDALVRMVWVAAQHLGKMKHLAVGHPAHMLGARALQGSQEDYRHGRLRALRSGSSPERQIPRAGFRAPGTRGGTPRMPGLRRH